MLVFKLNVNGHFGCLFSEVSSKVSLDIRYPVFTGIHTMHVLEGNFRAGLKGISLRILPETSEYRNVEGVFLSFPFGSRVSKRRAEEIISEKLKEGNINWLYRHGKEWILNLDELRSFITDWKDSEWMTGIISVQPEMEYEEKEFF